MQLRGWDCEAVDWIIDSDKYNLLDEQVVSGYEKALLKGVYRCIHLGTECTTFSRGTHPAYRDNAHLPGYSFLNDPVKRQYVADANKLVANTARLWKAALRSSVKECFGSCQKWLQPSQQKIRMS